jgi:ABC-type transporter Mla maintaining outer membrane lipid asymmetry permease subunit MlaE
MIGWMSLPRDWVAPLGDIGLVAEIGAMRITDEIDALEVMGINSMTFLCGTQLLAAAMVLPFVYLAGVGAGFFASYQAVVQQIGDVSSGGYFLTSSECSEHKSSGASMQTRRSGDDAV